MKSTLKFNGLNIKEINKKDWKKYKFSDLFENIKEKIIPKESNLNNYIGLEHLDSGSLHIKRYGDPSTLIGAKLKIYKDDIILAKRNAYLKRAAIANCDAVASAHSLVLRRKSEFITYEFAPFLLMSETFWQIAIDISVGSLSPTINWKSLAKQEFLLPPKDQQAKLAELLWAKDEVIERENELLQAVSIAGEVKLKDLFIKEGEKETKDSKLGPINHNWKCVNLAKLIEEEYVISHLDGNHGSFYPRSEEFVEEGVPYISANCIEDDGISLKNAKYLTEERADTITKGIAKDGDILLAHNATVGPVCILKTDLDRIILSTSLTYYRVDKQKINPKFLFYYMKSRLFQTQLERVMSQSTRNQVPITTQRALYFIIPPIEIQNELIEKLVSISDTEKKVESKISSSKALQKSLINQVF